MRRFACASLVLVSLVTGGCSLQSARNEPPKDRRPVIREAAPRPGSAPRPSSITDGGKLAANEALLKLPSFQSMAGQKDLVQWLERGRQMPPIVF